jgi:flagellar basal body-associated protein FliL
MGAGAAGKKRGAIAFIFIILMLVVHCAGFITAIVASTTGNYCAGYIHNK